MQLDSRLNEISDCLYRLAVKAIIIQDKKVLLVKEQDDEWWSLPGGGIEYGEDVSSALTRELQEELGLTPHDMDFGEDIEFVNMGAVVEGIPKANIYISVTVSKDKIRLTKHVVEQGWFSIQDIQKLYISPSTGDIKNKLASLISS